jgi:hypothetical protein
MADRPESRIVLEKARNGKREVVIVDPRTGRESRTGLQVANNERAKDALIKQLAEPHKRCGNTVSVKEVN